MISFDVDMLMKSSILYAMDFCHTQQTVLYIYSYHSPHGSNAFDIMHDGDTYHIVQNFRGSRFRE